jgi:1,4-alpha-glucan branching enzyme
MKKFYLCFFLLAIPVITSLAQKVGITPTISPSLFRYNDQITVTYDVTGTNLANLSNAYIWVWIPGKNTDAIYNINPASGNSSTSNAKFTKSTDGGKTIFSLTFTPSTFFSSSISSETKLGMLLKGNDWSDGQTTDYVADFWDGSFQIKLNAPVQKPLFVSNGQVIEISAETPVNADFKLFVNDILKDESDNVKNYSYSHTVTEVSGSGIVKITASSGTTTAETSFQYLISVNSPIATRPAGIIPGINYSHDHTKATLCLLAPEKKSVYVRGDFTNWLVLPEYVMKRDGEYFWIEISGLTPAAEYAFQYLLDEVVYVADPYADKILDPDDQYIPAVVYPNLKPYPIQALSENWYFNRVSVLQTNQTSYNWQVGNFTKPAKENLVVYELLIRDFFGNGSRSYKNLADTVSYLKRLGINAIELLPIMEFNGNESWGYNPTFMFAPDKYYGPKNELKAFIDKCHQEGIAVILDIAMNHQDMPNTYVMMDFDFAAGKPKATNKWFNPDAKHPYNVFFDMNHESVYTKAYLDTVNYYWLSEYKVDGFRFDLSKGFTQKNNPSNVTAWSAYDDTRVAILKRMADKIWSNFPDAYVILEHLAVNQEEKELAEYRASEGKGMMLWGNINHAYNQATMGYSQESDISGVSSGNRNWTVPHLVAYMESHDEERLAFKNKTYGNSVTTYSTKDQATSIDRIKAASVVFYSVPGPKMLWQFGELAYDYSINHCENGTINESCRVSPKPVRWDYYADAGRQGLFYHTADLIDIHTKYPVFANGTATVTSGTSLVKQVTVKGSPYTASPASTNQMNVQAVANFELAGQVVAVNFPHTGIWYDYYDGGTPVNVTSIPFQVQLQAGGFKLYTDVSIGVGPVTDIEHLSSAGRIDIYPNPTTGKFAIDDEPGVMYRIFDLKGVEQLFRRDGKEFDISELPAGMYILLNESRSGRKEHSKVIKY